jgi:hypothetical protein
MDAPTILDFEQNLTKTLAHRPTHRCIIVKLPVPNQWCANHLWAMLPPFHRSPMLFGCWSKRPPPPKPATSRLSSRTGFWLSQLLETLPGEIPMPLRFFRRKPYRKRSSVGGVQVHLVCGHGATAHGSPPSARTTGAAPSRPIHHRFLIRTVDHRFDGSGLMKIREPMSRPRELSLPHLWTYSMVFFYKNNSLTSRFQKSFKRAPVLYNIYFSRSFFHREFIFESNFTPRPSFIFYTFLFRK